jgi:uncharacterized protein with PQ loop repeat
MLPLLATAATISGLLAAFLPAVQIATMWRSRSSAGISLPFLVGGLANNVVWTVYAVALHSVPLIAPNVLGLFMNVTMVTVAVRYRPRRHARTPVTHLRLDAELATAA